MSYLELKDDKFSEKISLRDSYELMYQFVLEIHKRGEVDTSWLLGSLGVCGDGSSTDPAQLYDYISVFNELKNQRKLFDSNG
ncbi:hypothetical protein [Microbulbifer variabilis]|uniref:Uncharacterized protein n=1 Tax=Microbulbifer variabilis TaxID=266805 RepID=A0ABY4VIJ3_9GAMM|nr:hypothetical protein [Microbulbifer variabilis]USD22650.1 hypothetical protein MJO52_05820 [Microbulbifer variabilis]